MFTRFMRLMDAVNDDKPTGGDADKIQTLEQRLAVANGSAMVVAQQLSNENADLKRELRGKGDTIATLTAEVSDLKKKLPAEGARILTKEEAATFDALVALGTPADIKAKLDMLPGLETKIAEAERGKTLEKVAELAGYNAKAFGPLAKDLDFEIKNENGKESPFVKTEADGKITLTPVAEYFQSNFAEFLPALKPDDQRRRHNKQDPPGKGGSLSVFDRIRQEEKEKQEKAKDQSIPLERRLGLAQAS